MFIVFGVPYSYVERLLNDDLASKKFIEVSLSDFLLFSSFLLFSCIWACFRRVCLFVLATFLSVAMSNASIRELRVSFCTWIICFSSLIACYWFILVVYWFRSFYFCYFVFKGSCCIAYICLRILLYSIAHSIVIAISTS